MGCIPSAGVSGFKTRGVSGPSDQVSVGPSDQGTLVGSLWQGHTTASILNVSDFPATEGSKVNLTAK